MSSDLREAFDRMDALCQRLGPAIDMIMIPLERLANRLKISYFPEDDLPFSIQKEKGSWSVFYYGRKVRDLNIRGKLLFLQHAPQLIDRYLAEFQSLADDTRLQELLDQAPDLKRRVEEVLEELPVVKEEEPMHRTYRRPLRVLHRPFRDNGSIIVSDDDERDS